MTVRLFAGLRSPTADVGPGVSFGVDLGDEATLSDLVGYLRLPAEQVRMIFVNGRARPLDWVLQPADQVGVFPPVGGG